MNLDGIFVGFAVVRWLLVPIVHIVSHTDWFCLRSKVTLNGAEMRLRERLIVIFFVTELQGVQDKVILRLLVEFA
mgnify:CR=1 FL=1